MVEFYSRAALKGAVSGVGMYMEARMVGILLAYYTQHGVPALKVLLFAREFPQQCNMACGGHATFD